MTTITKKKFTPKVKDSVDGVRISPRDVADSLLLIRVNEVKEKVVTKFKAEGSDAISIDVVSVETGSVALDQLWFNGALVDGLRDYVGEVVPCRLEWVKSQSTGYPYLAVAAISDEEDKAVDLFIANNPNIFDRPGTEAPGDPAPSKAPAAPAAKPRW